MNKNAEGQNSTTVDASPVKSFFVNMLTRDIKLEDAILDLLDNCVDGILRSGSTKEGNEPYQGYYAHIKYDKNSFSIEDNCGGIPWSLHNYAFRMGRATNRPSESVNSVGVYGIGMKRAIFKIGRYCLISTRNEDHEYQVEINSEWLTSTDWNIPVKENTHILKKNGTKIHIEDIYDGIKESFGIDEISFTANLYEMISTHYAFIIAKGFNVKINDKEIEAKPTKLIFMEEEIGIKPFIYKAKIEDVEIFLAVGFTRPLPSENELDEEQNGPKYSSMDAGWTIVCNDRAVVYCDRTELTGWGESNVPRYHTQFIAISGIVEFRAKDATKLPTTTTKRGVDASSRIYLQVKNKMREGMVMFTGYTNKWKKQPEETRKQMDKGKFYSLEEIKKEAINLKFQKTTNTPGEQYKPNLPMPENHTNRKAKISFARDREEVCEVAEYLFDDRYAEPSKVGEECYERILRNIL